MAPEFEHLGEALDEATVPIVNELRERLDAELSGKDWLAVETAVAKAALVGLKRGARELSEQADEALPSDHELSYDLDLVCDDRWAERFGRTG